MIVQESKEVKPPAGRITEGFLEEEGLDIWLEGREGLERPFLSLPILISPRWVCVCLHLSVSFWGLHFPFYHLLGLGQSFLRACVLGV